MHGSGNLVNNLGLVKPGIAEEYLQQLLSWTSIIPNYILKICFHTHMQEYYLLVIEETSLCNRRTPLQKPTTN